jgi:hypothetical protein
MTAAKTMRAGLALLAAGLILAGCGNGPNDRTALIKALPAALKKPEPPAPLSAQQIAQALTATAAPVQMYEVESRKAQFLMQQIETNGPYRTYGSSSRQVVNMRGGIITSTRGLGGDLMSSDSGALLARLAARSAGSAPYVMRFLTPEDVTVVAAYDCRLSPGGARPVSGGLVQTSGTVMRADCRNAETGHSFTNSYVVGGDGYVLSARQYLGGFLGYVTTQALRR